MELSKQVTSKELSERMKELGFPQESLYHWAMFHPSSTVLPGPSWQLYRPEEFISCEDNEYIAFSAFTVSELGEMIRNVVWPNTPEWQTIEWRGLICEVNNPFFSKENEANARARVLIYLREQKLI